MNHVVNPGRYIRADAQEGGGEAIKSKMERFAVGLRQELAKAARLAADTAANLKELGYGG